MIPTAPLLTALGETVSITPSGGAAVSATAIVHNMPVLGMEGDRQWHDLYIEMPASPAYAVGDAVSVRGQSRSITRVMSGSDRGWLRYQVG